MSAVDLQTSLDAVQKELFLLMLRDSYPRFLVSSLAKRYAKKLPIKNADSGEMTEEKRTAEHP